MYHQRMHCPRQNQKTMVNGSCCILVMGFTYYLISDIVFGENMQLMPINRPSTVYINSDESLANINVTVIGMLIEC